MQRKTNTSLLVIMSLLALWSMLSVGYLLHLSFEQGIIRDQVQEIKASNELAIQDRCVEINITAYIPTGQPTSTLQKTMPGKTAAVSRDLAPFLLGRKIYIPGKGVWLVNDTTHKDIKNTVDLCVGTHKQALAIGRTESIAVIID